MTTIRSVVAAIAATSYLAAGAPALAQPAAPGEGTPAGDAGKPWARGVSPEDQAQANALFKEGNALLRDSFFVQAVEKYREAVHHWDHPAIHYNLALALINLDQPLEVHASLVKALGHGGAALDAEKIELAERYKKLVEQQLARITLTCHEPDAKVFVDGKDVGLACPGSQERLVRSGEHTFSASKPGFEATVKTLILPGGDARTVDLKLYTPDELTRYDRRFPSWMPYAVTGGGVALVGIGALLHSSAKGDFESFDQQVADCEREAMAACDPTSSMLSLRDGASTKQTVAVTMYGVGAAAVLTGLTLVILNRPRPYRIDLESSGESVGMSATFSF